MRNLFAVLAFSLLPLSTPVALAQQGQVWVELETHGDIESAIARARQLSGEFPDVRGIRTEDERFVLAVGRASMTEARRLRDRLAKEGRVPSDYRLNRDLPVAAFFWSSRSSAPPGTPLQAPEVESTAVVVLEPSERLAVQTALRWFNDYDGAIDGLFGPQTRKAISSFQERTGHPVTGQLTRTQSNQLLNHYNVEIARVRLEVIEDEATGISISMPWGLVRFSAYDSPFVVYESTTEHGLNIYLLSMEGNSNTLKLIYDILLNSDFFPGEKTHRLRSREFRIDGADETTGSMASVSLTGNRLKGFAATWDAEHTQFVERILLDMLSSLRESHQGTLDPGLTAASLGLSTDLLSDLPRIDALKSASGFYADKFGMVATTASVTSECGSIMVDRTEPMQVLAADSGLDLAVLGPLRELSPIRHAQAGRASRAKGERVYVSGYSYGGEFGYPTLTLGAWVGRDVLTENPDLALIESQVLPGDIGGPVLDSSGMVVGMLRPPLKSDRMLPSNVNPLVAADAIWRNATIAADADSDPVSSHRLDAVDLSRHARAITVLVECYGTG